MDKLIIPKRDTNERTENTQPIRINKKALALVNELCADTNRTQTDIASRRNLSISVSEMEKIANYLAI